MWTWLNLGLDGLLAFFASLGGGAGPGIGINSGPGLTPDG